MTMTPNELEKMVGDNDDNIHKLYGKHGRICELVQGLQCEQDRQAKWIECLDERLKDEEYPEVVHHHCEPRPVTPSEPKVEVDPGPLPMVPDEQSGEPLADVPPFILSGGGYSTTRRMELPSGEPLSDVERRRKEELANGLERRAVELNGQAAELRRELAR